MKILRVGIVLAFIASQFTSVPVADAASANVVISQLQTAGSGTGTAGQEFIELYNNSDSDVNVTGWYLTYSSASDASQSTVFRMTTVDAQTALWLKAKSYALIVSPDYKTATGIAGDGTFTYVNGMAATAGHVRLYDGSNMEIDKVAWGATTVTPPEVTAPTPQGGKSLQRSGIGVLQDTDNNATDFMIITPVLHATNPYEVVTIIDVCPNVAGIQQTIPGGYLADESGNCQVDSCINIVGLQVSVPDGYDSDDAGNCVQHDECSNITGVQTLVPDNMIRATGNDCVWDLTPLVLSEVLPNAAGSDTGNEFVEIYNPTNRVVDLSLYSIRVGVNSDKVYAFPAGATIAPFEYRIFSDSAMKFTHVNTTGRVLLVGVDDVPYGDTGVYDSPGDDMAWALIDGAWQYTNQSTPGAQNHTSVVAPEEETEVIVAPCASGKYRNPLTNRCRNIESDASVLSTCEADQYRNPETGRCKKIVTVTSALCKEGQYRSEETNRCRNIVTASTQKPCKDTQYRSEETGRCRNIVATSVPESAFAVQPVKDSAMAFVGWWALGGVGLLALGYAGWEWRTEIRNGFFKAISTLSGRK